MGIGVGIVLMAIGAILTFAVHATVNGIDINTVGVILMIAGAVGLLVDIAIFAPRRRVVGGAVAGDRVVGDRVVTEERVTSRDAI